MLTSLNHIKNTLFEFYAVELRNLTTILVEKITDCNTFLKVWNLILFLQCLCFLEVSFVRIHLHLRTQVTVYVQSLNPLKSMN